MQSSSRFNRPRPVAWFFFLAALATTVGLGSWQVQRLAWKEQLIAAIDTAKQSAPLTVLSQNPDELKAKNFYPVTLRGTWVGDKEFDISPRFFKGKLGYFIVTPFKLDDGRTLLVNRGWVPSDAKDPFTRGDTAVRGRDTITGMIRYGDERNWLTPVSDPARNLWFGRDIMQMADSAKLKNPVPAMVDLVGEQDAQRLPVPSDGTIRLRNDHLSYIITWYGIALGILIIFVLYHRKK